MCPQCRDGCIPRRSPRIQLPAVSECPDTSRLEFLAVSRKDKTPKNKKGEYSRFCTAEMAQIVFARLVFADIACTLKLCNQFESINLEAVSRPASLNWFIYCVMKDTQQENYSGCVILSRK